MKANLLLNADVDIRVRAAKSIDQVVVHLGSIGNLWLEVDDAHTLIDGLREALRDLAESEARRLQRDEDGIRSAAEIREDR